MTEVPDLSKLPDNLQQLAKDMPQEFEFIQDIVQAAYELGIQRGNERTIKYLENLLDQYGIDRPSV